MKTFIFSTIMLMFRKEIFLEEEKMKTKIIGLVVCFVMIAAVFSIGKPIQSETMKPVGNNLSSSGVLNDDVVVPTWTVGNRWSYEIEMLTADIVTTNQSYNFTMTTENLTLTVIDVGADTYTVAFDVPKISGGINISFIREDGFINITASLDDTTLNGTIVFGKPDLGVQQFQVYLAGRLHAKITDLPSISLRHPISVRGKADIMLLASYNVSYPLIAFPFDVGSFWGRPAVNISLDGTIKAPWLNKMSIINNIARKHWNVMEFLCSLLGVDSVALKNISDVCYDLLPVVDIGNALKTYMTGNSFNIPSIPPIVFSCLSPPETMTVTAGTFTAYNITVGLGMGNVYYAPDVGNIIKIGGHFTDANPYLKTLELQLIDTNYP
jgi:hypothetical protein